MLSRDTSYISETHYKYLLPNTPNVSHYVSLYIASLLHAQIVKSRAKGIILIAIEKDDPLHGCEIAIGARLCLAKASS